ncbi:MAG: hypothetical protein ACREDE_11795, partial [Thermoplasmata archaeon]
MCPGDGALVGSSLPTYGTGALSVSGGPYFYCYAVTDSSAAQQGGEVAISPWDHVTVSAGLSAGPVSPGSPDMDTGQSITLMANPSGGTTPYSYVWYSSGTGSGACAQGAMLGAAATQIVSPTANKYYCYTVTDGGQSPVTQGSTWDKVSVGPELASGSVSPPSRTIDYGQSTTLTANPSGGTTPYVDQWYWSGSSSGTCISGTALGTGSTQTTGREVAGPGTYYYCYEATDGSQGNGGPETASSPWAVLTATSTLTAPGPPAVSATELDVNQP